MHRVAIIAAADNTASRAVAERLNFELEGILREDHLLDGVYHDGAVYGKLNPIHKA